MSKKTWIIFSVIVVAILGGLIYMSGKNKVDVSGLDKNSVLAASADSGNIADHTLGDASSKVVFIEYGDYQCPGCGSVNPVVKEVVEEYKDKIVFVFRNFPLTTIHPNARVAAAAAEAAGLQGKYWEYHNHLFTVQSEWKNLSGTERTDAFVGYAEALGLNSDTFKTDIASSAVNKKISFDQAIAKAVGVSSTPTFVLNGKTLEQSDWASADTIRAALDAALKEKGLTPPTKETSAE